MQKMRQCWNSAVLLHTNAYCQHSHQMAMLLVMLRLFELHLLLFFCFLNLPAISFAFVCKYLQMQNRTLVEIQRICFCICCNHNCDLWQIPILILNLCACFLRNIATFAYIYGFTNISLQLQWKWETYPICFLPKPLRGSEITDLDISKLHDCLDYITDEEQNAASTSHNFLERGKNN